MKGGIKMAKEYRVNVTDEDGNALGRVRYNSNLDYWDGRNWSNGGVGIHLGLTKLKDGSYVLIHGTQWEGAIDSAKVVSPMMALQSILKSQNLDLLDTKKFKDLKTLAEEKGILGNDDDLEEE